MKRVSAVLVSLFIAALLTISAGAWIEYDTDYITRCMPFISKIQLNDDGSMSIALIIDNSSDKDAENFTLPRAVIWFGDFQVDFSRCIKNRTIDANSHKKYIVKIAASKVPDELTTEFLYACRYEIEYAYNIGKVNHKGTITTNYGEKR